MSVFSLALHLGKSSTVDTWQRDSVQQNLSGFAFDGDGGQQGLIVVQQTFPQNGVSYCTGSMTMRKLIQQRTTDRRRRQKDL